VLVDGVVLLLVDVDGVVLVLVDVEGVVLVLVDTEGVVLVEADGVGSGCAPAARGTTLTAKRSPAATATVRSIPFKSAMTSLGASARADQVEEWGRPACANTHDSLLLVYRTQLPGRWSSKNRRRSRGIRPPTPHGERHPATARPPWAPAP
jgi:hypothetical protein